ncbi:MAG TPA: carboxymuconolactone decarboxylase family protein [Terriglobales bacterium]|jgi:AhpD family alkylhydroperoxidase|nr:carboxymuconolactone decarboxylase family protein [Terriglobales bacterium]
MTEQRKAMSATNQPAPADEGQATTQSQEKPKQIMTIEQELIRKLFPKLLYNWTQGEMNMKSRLDATKASPSAYKAMLGLEHYLAQSSIERPLRELVKMRVSQINGCAYCLDMHSKDARAGGETEQRLYLLNAWREAPFYSDRERAALAWAEALTLVHETHVPDEVYEETRKHFSEAELMDLTLLVTTINSWNRIAIAFRSVPGTYKPAQQAVAV